MVRIGAHLAGRGDEVTVLTGPEHRSDIIAAGLRAASLPTSTSVQAPGPAVARTLLPPLLRRYLTGRSELQSVFIEPLRHQYQAVRELLANDPFDALLVDVAFTGVLPLLLSQDPRPPVLVCGVGPLMLSSRDTPPFGMAWQPEASFDYRAMTRFAHRVLFGDVKARLDRELRLLQSVPAPEFISDWPRLADGLLQLSMPGFEYPRNDLPAGAVFVGPVLPAGPDEVFERPPWWGDMAEAPIVVHVTQGTFDNTNLGQLIGPTMAGLADREDVLVVASTGGRRGHVLRGATPGNGRIANWVPYSQLMPHVDVMVTNGGYGGVQHALSHGVPLVVAGETSDKAEVAARVQYTGAGIDLGTARPSATRVASAVDRILRDGTFRAAAGRLGAEIATADPLTDIAQRLASHATLHF
jgi:UDP:flavonoid glycosyltransferase YjiC (YdhE family)